MAQTKPPRWPRPGFYNIWQGLEGARREELAMRLESSTAAVGHYAHGHRRMSPVRARDMVAALREMGVSATDHDMRPDLW